MASAEFDVGVIGECMLEMRESDDGQYQLGYGGDVFNTAVYLARQGATVGFVTATGDDHFSDYLVDNWQQEGVDTRDVKIIAGATPSLYLIRTDDRGERQFDYWRSATPFRQLLAEGDYQNSLPDRLRHYRWLYLSGITLALLSAQDRQRLLGMLSDYRLDGGQIAFDPNYRARLWQSSEDALRWINAAYQIADLVLSSMDDERLLRSETEPNKALFQIRSEGCGEVVLTNGSAPSVSSADCELSHEFVAVPNPVDTTAAGDAFNAGYLYARINGQSVSVAVDRGHQLAASVVQVKGAIIPRPSAVN